MDNEYEFPWKDVDKYRFGEVLKAKKGVIQKKKELTEVLLRGRKPEKEAREEFPFSEDAILKLLAGGTVKPKELFCKEEYAEVESFLLAADDDKLQPIATEIGEDFALIEVLRALYDWSILADVLESAETISESKVLVYERHKEDLRILKYFIRTYCPECYDEMFRACNKENYVAYSYHIESKDFGRSNPIGNAENRN